MNAQTEAVDAETIARRYNVSPRTVHRLAAAGAIPSYKVGHARRFDPEAVDAALKKAAAA